MADRRGFVRALLGGATGFAFASPRQAGAAELAPDDAWLNAIASRKHRAFLDVPTFHVDGTPFRRTNALLAALTGSYQAKPAEIGVAFGAHGTAIGYLMRGSVWRDLALADHLASRLNPPDANQPRLTPDAAAAVGSDGVRDLIGRGVRVLACRNTIGRWARELAARRGVPEDEITKALLAGMHEGVEVVPAMVAAAVIAQSRGVGYALVQ